jgi:hypothetical protein
MSTELSDLQDAVETYRTQRDETRVEKIQAERNPYGRSLHDLNVEWGKTKAEHEAKIKAQRDAYLKRASDLRNLSKAWDLEHPVVARPVRGRIPNEWPDEVKRAAAQAIEAGTNKSLVRTILGLSDTERLNRLLAEGDALLHHQDGAEW